MPVAWAEHETNFLVVGQAATSGVAAISEREIVSILSKVKGLWRFNGDTEPVQVSRRSFLFMGGVVVAGLALPLVGEVAALDNFALQNLFKERYRFLAPALFDAPWLEESPMQKFWPQADANVRALRIDRRAG